MTSPAANTPYRAITLGLQDAGVLAFGVTPSSELLAECMGRLNDVVAFYGTQGIKLWLQQDVEVTLVASQPSYTFRPGGDVDVTRPLRILPEAYYLDTNANKRPLTMLSKMEYVRLSNVVQTGPISQFFVDKLQDRLTVYFWLVPDASAAEGTAHLIVQHPASRFTSLVEELEFPQEWFLALRWALADEMSTGQPLPVQQRCKMNADAYRVALENWDVEDADVRFAVDSSRGGSFRSFR